MSRCLRAPLVRVALCSFALVALCSSALVAPTTAGAWWSWGAQPCGPWEATALAGARAYVEGWACPADGFVERQGYQPTWVFHAGFWHVVDPTAGCTSSPDRSWYFDFRAACGIHDYCYDLGREQYGNVWKADCDWLFYEVAIQDCATRWSLRSKCLGAADSYWRAVRILGVWWFNPSRGN